MIHSRLARTSSLDVRLGSDDGTFQPEIRYLVGSEPSFVVAGNLNGDGVPDLATANQFSNNVTVLLNQHDGTRPGRGAAAKPPRPTVARGRSPRLDSTLEQVTVLTPLPAPPSPGTTGATAIAPPPVLAVPPPDAFFAALAAEEPEAPFARPRWLDLNTVDAWPLDGDPIDETVDLMGSAQG